MGSSGNGHLISEVTVAATGVLEGISSKRGSKSALFFYTLAHEVSDFFQQLQKVHRVSETEVIQE